MYIEINLLPRDLRPKRPGLRLNFQGIVVLAAIIAAGGLGWHYYQLDTEMKFLERQQQMLTKERMMLTDAINLQKEVDALTLKVRARVDIIKELTVDSGLRFAMLKHVNKVMPENLWLMNITETAGPGKLIFNVQGMAYSKESISGFLEGLQGYEKFNKVLLRSIKPSPMEIRDAFEYMVSVEMTAYQSPEPIEDPKNKKNNRARR